MRKKKEKILIFIEILKKKVYNMEQFKGGCFMVKNVVINEQTYTLNLKKGVQGKTSGICCRLKTKEEDLAVKIFYPHIDHISEQEIEVFQKIESQVHPVLISKYPVFNVQGEYIGSASSFIQETEKGKSKNLLYTMEKDFVLENLEMIQGALPIFNQRYISLFNFGVHNILIGRGTHLPQGMYLIDDSYDMVGSSDTEFHNQEEFYRLIRSIVKNHLVESGGPLEDEEFVEEYLNEFMGQLMNSRLFYEMIPQLEKEMLPYATFQEYLDDYYETTSKKLYMR